MSAHFGPGSGRSARAVSVLTSDPEKIFVLGAAGVGMLVYLLSFADGADVVFRLSPWASPMLVLTALVILLGQLPNGPELLPVALLTSVLGSLSLLHFMFTAPTVTWAVVVVLLLGLVQTALLVLVQLARLRITKLPGSGGGRRAAGQAYWPGGQPPRAGQAPDGPTPRSAGPGNPGAPDAPPMTRKYPSHDVPPDPNGPYGRA